MTLYPGNIIKLISVDAAAIRLTDWLNSREAVPGDIAIVEDVSINETGRVVRLLCEPQAGFLEWRIWFQETGVTYELLAEGPGDAFA